MKKIKDIIELNRIIFNIAVIAIFLSNSFSCISQKENGSRIYFNNSYRIENIDTNFFRDYIMIILKTSRNENKYLLSTKNMILDTTDLNNNYEELLEKKVYNFNLFLNDSVFVIYPKQNVSHIQGLLNNWELYWNNDTLRVTTYFSHDIIGKYLKK